MKKNMCQITQTKIGFKPNMMRSAMPADSGTFTHNVRVGLSEDYNVPEFIIIPELSNQTCCYFMRPMHDFSFAATSPSSPHGIASLR